MTTQSTRVNRWLIGVFHVVFFAMLSLTIISTANTLNQLLMIGYILATIVYRLESRWLAIEVGVLMVVYLPLTYSQLTVVPQHELLMVDAFYLLIGVAIALIREVRGQKQHE